MCTLQFINLLAYQFINSNLALLQLIATTTLSLASKLYLKNKILSLKSSVFISASFGSVFHLLLNSHCKNWL